MEQLMMPELETPAPAKAQQAWSLVRLGDICEPVKGVSSSFFNQNDEFKYIDIASIDRETKQIIASSTIPSKEAPSRAKYPLLKGDILVSTVRPNLNAVAMVNDYYEGTIASSGFCVLRTLQNEILSDYLFFFTRTNTFVEYLNSLATGASYPAVNDKIVKSAQIPLPPLAEQQRIVVRLDLAQRLIDQRKAQLALMDQLVQSLFYEMFGDPVKNEMGWTVKAFKDVLEEKTQNGLYVPKEQYCSDDGVEMVHMSDAFYGTVKLDGIKRVVISEKELKKFSLIDTDLLLARRFLNFEGAVKPCVIPKINRPLVYESSLIRVRPDLNQLSTIYLFHYLSNERARNAYILEHISTVMSF